jgi:LmbE family N-acetylglucosaminyl deacetylase
VTAPRAPVPERFERVLAVGAHPDDPDFHFGATLARLASEGAEVQLVICTEGTQGDDDPSLSTDELRAERRREQERAAAALGIRQVTFLCFPDGRLEPTLDLRRAIVREIRRCRPDLVLTHFPKRVVHLPIEASHPDHVAVGEATLAAIFPDAGNPRAFTELLGEGLAPHKVAEVWLPGYERPNHFVDAGPFVEAKVAAILCHGTQLGDAPPDEAPPWVYQTMRMTGERAGFEYAESFVRYRLAWAGRGSK